MNEDEMTERVFELTQRLREQCDRATVQQFRNRLENTTLIYAYVEKRFKERFPEEYTEWEREHDQ